MSQAKKRFDDRWQRSRTVFRAPRVQIELYGDQDVHETFRDFTARHPRFRFTSAKRWGVGLVSRACRCQRRDASKASGGLA